MLAAALILAFAPVSQNDAPRAQREFRAVWVATVDNIDWPSRRTLTTEQQKAELIRILETVDEHHGEYSADPPYSLLAVIEWRAKAVGIQ